MNIQGLMSGKCGLIMGVANRLSIAWGIARSCHEAGAELAFSYQGDALEKRIKPLANSVDSNIILPCDVSDEESIANLFANLKKEWGQIDFIVHAIAFADKNYLIGRYIETPAEVFSQALHISCYSLTSIARHAESMMNENSSILTLSYYGAEKIVTQYNVMGVAKAALESSVRYLAYDLGPKKIRVNAISAGAIRTLASAGVSNFRDMLNKYGNCAPLKDTLTSEDIGTSGVYLLSDLSSAVTGEIHYVDNGFNALAFTPPADSES